MSFLPGVTITEKLLLNHEIAGSCWRWTGAHTPTGYGQMQAGGRVQSVHRLSYEAFVGPIPDGLEIDHLCRVRDCINPDHLEPVTHHENLLRISAAKTRCKHGHEFTEDNTLRDKKGRRRCRTCRLRQQRKWRERRATA